MILFKYVVEDLIYFHVNHQEKNIQVNMGKRGDYLLMR